MRKVVSTFYLLLPFCLGTTCLAQQNSATSPSLPIFQAETWQVPAGSWLIDQVCTEAPAPVSLGRVQPSPYFLPKYARQNPSGYSFLCRKELQLEDRLPVGIWFEMEPDEAQQRQTMSVPRLQFKLPLTGKDRR